MTLVQIDLRRSREPRPGAAPPAPKPAGAPTWRSAAVTARALGVGLVLLIPLAEPALRSLPALVLMMIGLAVLGLIAALLRPTGAEVDPS